MSERIVIHWADMTDRTAHLIPWWVGCQFVERGSRFSYWHPVEDAVNERVNGDPDLGAWLTSARLDYVDIELGSAGLLLFKPGRIDELDDGGVGYEIGIPDEIAHSRNLDEVQEFLLEQTMVALNAIARRLRIALPPARTAGDLANPPVPRGRLADIAVAHGAERPLVLISPRYTHRPRFGQLKAALAAREVGVGGGWAAHSVNPDTTRRVSIDTEFDFAGVVRPIDPDILLRDSRHVCLLIAAANHPLPLQREQLEACTALVNDHLPVRASVAGNDDGVLWTAAVINSPTR